MPFEVDETAQQLQALAVAEGLLGEVLRAQVSASMLELYLMGMIEVTFNEHGEPTASMIERSTPLVAAPIFVTPSLMPMQEQARQIGCKSALS